MSCFFLCHDYGLIFILCTPTVRKPSHFFFHFFSSLDRILFLLALPFCVFSVVLRILYAFRKMYPDPLPQGPQDGQPVHSVGPLPAGLFGGKILGVVLVTLRPPVPEG